MTKKTFAAVRSVMDRYLKLVAKVSAEFADDVSKTVNEENVVSALKFLGVSVYSANNLFMRDSHLDDKTKRNGEEEVAEEDEEEEGSEEEEDSEEEDEDISRLVEDDEEDETKRYFDTQAFSQLLTICRDAVVDEEMKMEISKDAVNVVQSSVEDYLTQLVAHAKTMCETYGREKITSTDLQLVVQLWSLAPGSCELSKRMMASRQ